MVILLTFAFIAGIITVDKDALYHIKSLPESGEHTLKLRFEGGGIELFAFTFG